MLKKKKKIYVGNFPLIPVSGAPASQEGLSEYLGFENFKVMIYKICVYVCTLTYLKKTFLCPP